jgi:carbon-monoxide dehydrogenase iron sulfur subunit
MTTRKKVWVVRDHLKCSGCRKCEIACSLHHENKIWPEASRIRVFMLVPGAEFPHFCVQCEDYPCVKACPQGALSVNKRTEAVQVDEDKCNACGVCIKACPGRVPHLHPAKKTILICDLCGGKPQCAKVCQEGKWGALTVVSKGGWRPVYRVFARKPEDVTKELVSNLYGEFGEAYT